MNAFRRKLPAIAQAAAACALALSIFTTLHHYDRARADELEPVGGAACPGAVVDYTLDGYDGPTGITGACVSVFRYTGGRITIVAYDVAQDGIFRSGFEQIDPEDTP